MWSRPTRRSAAFGRRNAGESSTAVLNLRSRIAEKARKPAAGAGPQRPPPPGVRLGVTRLAVRLLLVLALLAGAAPAARASQVIVVDGSGASVRDDPALPPASQTALPVPGAGVHRSAPCAATAGAGTRAVASATTVRQALAHAAEHDAITEDQRIEYAQVYRDAR